MATGSRTVLNAVIDNRVLQDRLRRVALVTVGLPVVATAFALASIPAVGVGAAALYAWGAMHLLTMLGITVGFHRLAAHRSFSSSRPAKWVLLVLGSMAAQGPVIHWVSNHRRHHEFSDVPGDVHSPYLDETQGLRGLKGFWHAHLGWMFTAKVTNPNRYSRELLRDPDIAVLNRHYTVIVLAGIVLPGALCGLILGSVAGVWQGILWGGLVRIFTVHHATWAINSITHMFGSRPWPTSDNSTNSWWLAIPSAGESWHNCHHAFPYSAKFGLEPWQVDLGYLAILFLKLIGQASGINLPTRERQLAKSSA